MREPDREVREEYAKLVADCRDHCLWFLRADYYPSSPTGCGGSSISIHRHGDREAFRARRQTAAMALTRFQREVCRLLAANRIAGGESYVAGGTALNELSGGARISRDIDLFHDTAEALEAAWESDRASSWPTDLTWPSLRERPAFVEALVAQGTIACSWSGRRDSAFRFFPLVQHMRISASSFTLRPGDEQGAGSRRADWRCAIASTSSTCDAEDPAPRLSRVGGVRQGPGVQPRRDPRASRTLRALLAERTGRARFRRSAAGPRGGRARLARAARAGSRDRRAPARRGSREMCSGPVRPPLPGIADRLQSDLAAGRLVFHAGSIRGAFPSVAAE